MLTGARTTAVSVFAAMLLLSSGTGQAKRSRPHPPPCPGGHFASRSGVIFGDDVAVETRSFDLTPCPRAGDALVRLPSCGTLPVKLWTNARGTRLLTRGNHNWAPCGTYGARVKLSGLVNAPACTAFRGTLLQRAIGDPVKIIHATRSECGNRIIDPGEECDGGPGCDADCHADAGGTGAFSVVTVHGTRKMYLPLPAKDRNAANHGVIAVVDAGVPGRGASQAAPALITDIDLGSSDVATATAGNSEVVVATSTSSTTVWIIDPSVDQVVRTFSVPAGTSHFSGGEGIVSGVAVDSAHHRAILSLSNGFALVDLNDPRPDDVVRGVDEAGFVPSENFGFDAIADRIVAPYYGSTAGLALFDLEDPDGPRRYEVHDPDAMNLPFGERPDSAAADPVLGLVVVAEEAGPIHVVDVGHADRDHGTGTVGTIAAHQKVVPIDLPHLTGVAIDRIRHLAFFEEEGNVTDDDKNSGVGVLDLAKATQDDVRSYEPKLVTARMPDRPDHQRWRNLGDPHGIAITTGSAGNTPLGFVVDDGTQPHDTNPARTVMVARIDLEKLASAGKLDEAVAFLDPRRPVTTRPQVVCTASGFETIRTAGRRGE